MRKDAQEEAADKQAKAERKAEQLRYRFGHAAVFPGCGQSYSDDPLQCASPQITSVQIRTSHYLLLDRAVSRFATSVLCSQAMC